MRGLIMKNNLMDLNNYLFECIERITDDDLSDDELKREIQRSNAVQQVAKNIIENSRLALEVKKHFDEYGIERSVSVRLLGDKE